MEIAKEIIVLTHGKHAFDYLSTCETRNQPLPELIIPDHHMLVMDGMELMQELNRTGSIKWHKVVFILLAVHTSGEDIAAFQQFGVQEYTPKPLSEEVIWNAYQKYFAHDKAKEHDGDCIILLLGD